MSIGCEVEGINDLLTATSGYFRFCKSTSEEGYDTDEGQTTRWSSLRVI